MLCLRCVCVCALQLPQGVDDAACENEQGSKMEINMVVLVICVEMVLTVSSVFLVTWVGVGCQGQTGVEVYLTLLYWF